MKRDCIIITVPEKFFREYPGGESQFKEIMNRVDQGLTTWGQTISGIPKQEVQFVYLCYRGKIQLRLTLLNFEKNCSKSFGDGGIIRNFRNKNWANLCGPVVWAERDFPQRGFQGFRYTEFLF